MKQLPFLLQYWYRYKKIFLCLVIFLFSVGLRLWNLNDMGRTWDEFEYVERGYNFVSLIQKRDFNNPYWVKAPDFPPFAPYIYGIVSRMDIKGFDIQQKPIFNYDYTHARLVSVLLTALSVVLVTIIGWNYKSPFVGIVSGIILSMLPYPLAFSHIASLESFILFFFTATVMSFLHFLLYPSKMSTVTTGILLGLSLLVKFTNILLVPLIIWIFLIWYGHVTTNKNVITRYIFLIVIMFLLAFGTVFVFWPMPWFHLQDVISFNTHLRYSPYSVPEVFFGRLLLVPKVYYIVHFFITTPLFILCLFLLGLFSTTSQRFPFINCSVFQLLFKKMKKGFRWNFSLKRIVIDLLHFFLFIQKDEKRTIKNKLTHTWILYAIIAWFCLPFIQSLYNYKQHGLRYIIEIYAPLSIIAAIGLEYAVQKLQLRTFGKTLAVFVVLVYLFFALYRISPYYLDYFNGVVGGAGGVYRNKMFQLGWWGQGIREAGIYIEKHAPSGAKIGIALSPDHVLPPLPNQKVTPYNPGEMYDYVIVNYYIVLRAGYDDTQIKQKYDVAYSVIADGAQLVTVYKKKSKDN